MRKIVFDIETKNVFQDVGSDNPADLDISLLCIYDYETNTYDSFLQEDFDRLWPLLKKAGRGDLTKIRSLDILKEIKNCYGRRMKLDQVAEGTLGINKSSNGLDAVVWWRNGEIEKIRKYCLDDVRITKDIYEYAQKHKKLMFKEGPFTKEIKMDIKLWEPVAEVKTQSLF